MPEDLSAARTTATTLVVNGRPVRTSAPIDTPLLYVLRNELGLTAAKFGCGAGRCGACTVHVDGRAETSCNAPLWSVADKSVTTLEGITGHDDVLDDVQQAFQRHGAIQCGYCIPGILMRLKALRSEESAADMARIRDVLSERHLCRCGTHVRILAAAADYFGGTGR